MRTGQRTPDGDLAREKQTSGFYDTGRSEELLVSQLPSSQASNTVRRTAE